MSSIGKIEKRTSNRFLNFYEFEAVHRDGSISPYYHPQDTGSQLIRVSSNELPLPPLPDSVHTRGPPSPSSTRRQAPALLHQAQQTEVWLLRGMVLP